MLFLEKYLAPVLGLFNSPSLTKVIKISPLIVVPLLIYILGSAYIENLGEKSKFEAHNERLNIIVDANQHLQPALGEFILRNYDSINKQNLNEFIKVYAIFNVNSEIDSIDVKGMTFNFLEAVRGLGSDGVQLEQSSNFILTLAQESKLRDELYLFLLTNQYLVKENYLDNLLSLLEHEDFKKLNESEVIKPYLKAFFKKHKISKTKQKHYFLVKKE